MSAIVTDRYIRLQLVTIYLQKQIKKRKSNLRLKAYFKAAKATPEYMAAVARIRVNGGRRAMLRQDSVLERVLPKGSQAARWVQQFRQSLCDASHYGQPRFRSVAIAVCFILTGQMHAIATLTSSAEKDKRLSYDPAISYWEMKFNSWLCAPLHP